MIRKSGHRFSKDHAQQNKEGSERGMTRPTAKEIKAMSDVAGVPVDNDVAARIANSIGPAFEGFAPVAGTLPFDLEPATYRLVHTPKVTK
jgi:hypothetical protein